MQKYCEVKHAKVKGYLKIIMLHKVTIKIAKVIQNYVSLLP